jgi:hypothetical protein
MSITLHPLLLCIVLKRFFWSATTRSKIDTNVSFPHSFDISPFSSTVSSNRRFSLTRKAKQVQLEEHRRASRSRATLRSLLDLRVQRQRMDALQRHCGDARRRGRITKARIRRVHAFLSTRTKVCVLAEKKKWNTVRFHFMQSFNPHDPCDVGMESHRVCFSIPLQASPNARIQVQIQHAALRQNAANQDTTHSRRVSAQHR